MQEVDLIKLFIERFDKLNHHYIVIGSIAAIIYVEPRLTYDMDNVIVVHEDPLLNLYKIFPDE
jgi:lantibiotic modifying enzyme